MSEPAPSSRLWWRVALQSLFLANGAAISTFASRVPTLQETLHLTDLELGWVLFLGPVGLVSTAPIGAWVLQRLGGRTTMLAMMLLFLSTLAVLGSLRTVPQAAAVLLVYGATNNLVHIAMNTSAGAYEAAYKAPIMAACHGSWSVGAVLGALLGGYMLGTRVSVAAHFVPVVVVLGTLTVLAASAVPRDAGVGQQRGSSFAVPSKAAVQLGFLLLTATICEGGMLDWSGVYLRSVVNAPERWIGVGLPVFLFTQAMCRFGVNRFVKRLGVRRTLQASALVVAAGFLLSSLLPRLATVTIGFVLVGVGLASVHPLVSTAALSSPEMRSKRSSASAALSVVLVFGYVGFLTGPPVVGVISHLTGLRASFAILATMGLCTLWLATRTPGLSGAQR